MRSAALLVIIMTLAFPADARLLMNDVLIPEPGFPGTSQQVDEAPQPRTQIVYIYANGQRIAKQQDGKTFYFHNDHLGSATVVTDEDGKVVEEKRYDPFGIELTGGSKIGYNSKELDRDTELNYYGARYYASEFGRFITADTIKGKLSNPQSLNLYAYTLNNPLKYVDPSGNQEKDSFMDVLDNYIPNVFHKQLDRDKKNIIRIAEQTNVPKEAILAGILVEDLRSYGTDWITLAKNPTATIRKIIPDMVLGAMRHNPNPPTGSSAYGRIHYGAFQGARAYLESLMYSSGLDDGTKNLLMYYEVLNDGAAMSIAGVAITQKAIIKEWERQGFDIFSYNFENINTFGERVGILITLNNIYRYDPWTEEKKFVGMGELVMKPHSNPVLGGTTVWQGRDVTFGEIAQKYVDEGFAG